MAQHHKWSLKEVEGCYPYERTIYVELLKMHLKELEDKRMKANRGY